MMRTNSQPKDQRSISYIKSQLSSYNDEKLTNAVLNAFNMMFKYMEPDGCLSTSVELYVILKYLGYTPKLCYGLVFLPNSEGEKHEIYHAWLELNNKVIDTAIYGNAKYSPYSFFDIEMPICNESYEDIRDIADYHPFEFDEDWNGALISKFQGRKISEYCDASPNGFLWDIICMLSDLPRTNENKKHFREVVEGDII